MDGLAFEEDDDMLREIRLVQAVNGPWGFDGSDDRGRFFRAAVAEGRRSLGAPGDGTLAAGEPADCLVLDLDRLDRDAILPVDPLDLVFARGTAAHVRELYVAGRQVVTEGGVLGLDLPAAEDELRARYRSALANSTFLRALPRYETALRRWYTERAGCC
jgi:cytosine/adenosine deaminase-related metal-dependent hydrolase